jgi:hypothetical protein
MNKPVLVIDGNKNAQQKHEVKALAYKLFKHFIFLAKKECLIEMMR